MRDKLLLLMKKEGLTSSRLAELLGIQPSSISHILGGRNKPSFDFVQKILRRFPNINPDWLLIDKGEMYRNASSATTEDDTITPTDEFATTAQPSDFSQSTTPLPGVSPDLSMPQPAPAIDNTAQQPLPISRGRVKRVIVLYDDHTFESYEISR